MSLYRVRKDGYFMGTFYKAGTELELFPKQAKYALLSGQLEAIAGSSEKAAPAKAHPVPKPAPSQFGERFSSRTVGGSMGGSPKR